MSLTWFRSPDADALAKSVGVSAAPVQPLEAFASLEFAANQLREQALPALPVIDESGYLGVVTESAIAGALLEGASVGSPVALVAKDTVPTLAPQASGAEALRAMGAVGSGFAVVVDGERHPIGVITASRLAAPPMSAPTPRVVGGMATPFGVYLTDGRAKGGAKWWALAATGALMFGLFLIGSLLGIAIAIGPWASEWTDMTRVVVRDAISVVVFLGGLRALPLTGLHAAEHKVVHAIERGERLTPEIVARMPRVHPRCGTNLAVGATVFLSLLQWEWGAGPDVRLLVAALVTLFVWRPLGTFAQLWLTTRKPTPRQIEKGIEAGHELMRQLEGLPPSRASVGMRLLNSGMPWIMLGALALHALYMLVMLVLGMPQPWASIM